MIKAIDYFQDMPLPKATAQLFNDLEVPLNRAGDSPARLGDILEKNFRDTFNHYVGDTYWVGQIDDNAFEGIEGGARELSQIRGKNYDTILVFALDIWRDGDRLPTRSQLFDLARAFNREFPYQPVVVVFRYGHFVSLAVVKRNDYQVKHIEGDKIGKMSLLRDIDILKPHTGHLRILQDMQIPRSGKKALTTFEGLYTHWQAALNVSTLNKKFYQELSNWYFWAIRHVQFPGEPDDADSETLKSHRAANVIRLITRLIFSWFLKEKKLIPDTLFDLDELAADYLKIDQRADVLATSGSEYYLAILQNLFFATLNQEMGSARRFKMETNVFPHPDHTIKNVYRHATFFKDKNAALALFQNIPFLNGGLFECLDTGKESIDGFTDTKKHQPSVPNFLFFQRQTSQADDLNEDYGTKGRRYEVRGLIHLLNNYKFTIAENTPLEEEVALDPELLGRIFENLLASYNPETKTTARKQTGSFYTPREIVNYMVDESLVAYLKNKLAEKRWTGREAELEQHLRTLFSESTEQPFIDSRDVEDLIAALDNCKILDPACGSGAFPMGILHRMVALLHKLDPKNVQWKKRQLENAEHIEDPEARTAALQAIERAFERNEFDYGRKLFLIEDCIFGVDIQPIAVQIAKLRFFISLICNQNIDDEQDNRGILALPNLETKFVAANTLIGLENATLAKQAVADLLDERERLHHRMFSANKYADKKRFREQDERLRIQIKEKLERTGWVSGDQSSQLANWSPFDQNTSAPFFDPQWMFGINDGFDVVIGNPPYVQLQSDGGKLAKTYEKQGFSTFIKTGDIYSLFYEKGVQLLSRKGILCFITSNKWMRADYGKKTRTFFINKTQGLALVDFGSVQIFDNATVDTNIFLLQNVQHSPKQPILSLRIEDDFDLIQTDLSQFFIKNALSIKFTGDDAWIIANAELTAIKSHIEAVGIPLKDWDIQINYGIKTGLNEAFIVDEATKDKLIAEDLRNAEILKPILRGRDIKKWKANFQDLWLIYVPWHFPLHFDSSINGVSLKAELEFKKLYPAVFNHLFNFKKELSNRNQSETGVRYEWYALQRWASDYYQEFAKPKIMWGNLNLAPAFLYEPNEVFTIAPCNIMTGENNIEIKYILSVLNSKLGDYCLKLYCYSREQGYFEYKKMFVEKVPIPKISESEQMLFAHLVEKILFVVNRNSPSLTFEHILDGMVCELYFPELMKEKELDILAQVEQDLAPYADFEQMSEGEKTAAVERLQLHWTHPDSIVRNRLALMPVRSPDVLGVILEGKS